MKICLAASSGGHIEEMLCIRELTERYECFYLTEENDYLPDLGVKTYFVKQINRYEKFFPIHFLKLILRSFRILWKEKPDCVICTGALAAVPMCYLARLFGKKVIFIESFARVEGPSLSGKLCYPIANLFLIQWEDLKKIYPKAVYVGTVY
ncbi:MAG: polysaccharide biosynthesis protein [Blautia sp.]|nr:polysaccharide biosynthesis protein [Blautia sp.]